MSFAAAFLRRYAPRDQVAATQYSLLSPGREGASANILDTPMCRRPRSHISPSNRGRSMALSEYKLQNRISHFAA